MAKIQPKPKVVATKVTKTADSTSHFQKKALNSLSKMNENIANMPQNKKTKSNIKAEVSLGSNRIAQANKDISRQANKGKAGFDKNGYKLKK